MHCAVEVATEAILPKWVFTVRHGARNALDYLYYLHGPQSHVSAMIISNGEEKTQIQLLSMSK